MIDLTQEELDTIISSIGYGSYRTLIFVLAWTRTGQSIIVSIRMTHYTRLPDFYRIN